MIASYSITRPTNGIQAHPLAENMPGDLQYWQLSVKQYHRMIDAGILDEDDPVELLEGWLVDKYQVASSPDNGLPDDLILWRLSVEQYHAMICAGILVDDDPVELLDGWLVEKMPKNPHHVFANDEIRAVLERMVPDGWHVKTQNPITLETSEPEPGIAVIRGGRRDYIERNPTVNDTCLVVEISDSTLRIDQGSKKRIYAQAGIPVYWIVNLVRNQIEVYTNPTSIGNRADYQQQQVYQQMDRIPVVIDKNFIGELIVRDLLP